MKQAIAACVAAVVVTLGAIALLAGGGGDEGGAEPFRFSTTTTLTPEKQAAREAADAWKAGVSAAIAPLQEIAGRYVTDAQSWEDGLVPDDTFRASLEGWKTDVTAVRINVEGLEPLEAAPAALPSYIALGALYDAAIDASTAALDLPEGQLRDQTARLARRLRILGDRAFARGEAAYGAAAFRPAPPEEATEDPLPDWAADGMAAGPPLEPEPRPPATTDVAEPTATVPREEWLAAVRGTGAPTAEEVFEAVRAGDPAKLLEVARRLDDAAAQLRSAPDPEGEGGREESARIRLGWLAMADIARLAHVAALVDQPALADRLRLTAGSLHGTMAVPAFSPPAS